MSDRPYGETPSVRARTGVVAESMEKQSVASTLVNMVEENMICSQHRGWSQDQFLLFNRLLDVNRRFAS